MHLFGEPVSLMNAMLQVSSPPQTPQRERRTGQVTKFGSTVRVDSLPHRKWREIHQQPGTAGPGNMLGCCLISFISCEENYLRALYCGPIGTLCINFMV